MLTATISRGASSIRSNHLRATTNRGVYMQIVNRLFLRLALVSAVIALPAGAQFKNGSQATELKLPTLSQRSIVTQRIGLSDITLNYCRPLVGGRELFGKTIAYGQVWRAGANENTVISFTDDVSV